MSMFDAETQAALRRITQEHQEQTLQSLDLHGYAFHGPSFFLSSLARNNFFAQPTVPCKPRCILIEAHEPNQRTTGFDHIETKPGVVRLDGMRHGTKTMGDFKITVDGKILLFTNEPIVYPGIGISFEFFNPGEHAVQVNLTVFAFAVSY